MDVRFKKRCQKQREFKKENDKVNGVSRCILPIIRPLITCGASNETKLYHPIPRLETNVYLWANVILV